MCKKYIFLTALLALHFILTSCHTNAVKPIDRPSIPADGPSDNQNETNDQPSSDEPSVDQPSNDKPSNDEPSDEEKPADPNAPLKALSYFKDEYLDRYIAYQEKNPDLTVEKIVTHVNVGLDYPYYSEEILSSAVNVGTNLVLANKYHALSADYEPTDLVTVASDCTTRPIKLCEEAARAFEQLSRAAKKDGYTIDGMSGYRSYSYQQGLYNGYLNTDTQANVDTYSARAGHSEHQTGLAMDVQDDTRSYNRFGETKAYLWALDNIHRFGFVIHYTAQNEFETGYKNEPWHFRYVGVDVATYLYNYNKNNPEDALSIDEYVARELSQPYTLATDIA